MINKLLSLKSAKPNEVYSKDRNSRQLSFSAPRNRDFIEQKIKKFVLLLLLLLSLLLISSSSSSSSSSL
jgi:hypothetical protein